MTNPPLTIFSASRQISFHQLLVAARNTWLTDALSEALRRIDRRALKEKLSTYVPTDAQQILATSGIRDEHIFPTPIVLENQPTLVGYYRLLLGLSQKTFYGTGTGMTAFKNMEAQGGITRRQKDL